MTEIEIQPALRESVNEVLEKMFFVEPPGESPNARPAGILPDQIAAFLTFEGEAAGSLSLRVTAAAARSIAADFLGDDAESISERQMAEVLCELANMICGSVLSRVESATKFNLAPPRIVPSPEDPALGPGTAVYAVDLANGNLTVAVTLGTPTCPEPAQSAS